MKKNRVVKKMKKEKGFTLIELLAVIIILALIALISVPLILNIIEKSRKSAFQNSAYGIMESARLYYVENIIDNKELGDKVFSYEEEENELKYKGTRPKGGTIIVKSNGKIEMSIHNEKWCAIKREDKESIEIIDYNKETCKIESPMIEEGIKLSYIESGLDSAIPGSYYNIRNQKGIVTCINLSDENKEVTNTKELKEGENSVKCRMIYENKEIASLSRTFMVKKQEKTADEIMNSAPGENGIIVTDLDGNKRFAGSNPNNWICFGDSNITDPSSCDDSHKWRIIGAFDGKLKAIANYYYGTRKKLDSTGGAYGNNDWGRPADLKTELNESSFYTNNTYIDEIHRSYIANATWYTGGQAIAKTYTLQSFVDGEKAKNTLGYVGLMSIVDLGYAGSECTLSTSLNYQENVCISNNWIIPLKTQWSITPYSTNSSQMWYIMKDGKVSFSYANDTLEVRPVIYLESMVKTKGGKGTETEPYLLSL